MLKSDDINLRSISNIQMLIYNKNTVKKQLFDLGFQESFQVSSFRPLKSMVSNFDENFCNYFFDYP